jgi:hypothetical protein
LHGEFFLTEALIQYQLLKEMEEVETLHWDTQHPLLLWQTLIQGLEIINTNHLLTHSAHSKT